MQTTANRFIVGDYIVEPPLNRITGPGGISIIEPKVMHVLTCLVNQPGSVLTKEALIEEVWEGTVVTDYVVSRSISQLRKIFNDSFKSPTYIETVSKSGYRLIAPVCGDEQELARPISSVTIGDSQPELTDAIEVVPHVESGSMHSASPQTVKAFPGKTLSLLAVLAILSTWVGSQWLVQKPDAPLTATLLTSTLGLETSPIFSPDGSMVVYVHYDPESRYDIYVKMLNGESALQLTNHLGSDLYPVWSVDGQRIYFQRVAQGDCALFEIPALGGIERKLMDCKNNQFYLNGSPDGSSFLITEKSEGSVERHITLLDADTYKRTQITTPPPSHSDFYPAFSPNGQQIAFIRGLHGEIGDLYVLPKGGVTPLRLTFDNRNIAGFTWAYDGRSLLFSSNRTGQFRLWEVDIATGNLNWLPDIATLDPGGPNMSPTGTHLAYEEWVFELNIWELDLKNVDLLENTDLTKSFKRRFASTRSDFQPHYAPNGKQTVFVSNRSGSPELWIGSIDDLSSSLLVSMDSAYLQMPRWSPDGKEIAYEAYWQGHAQIFTVDASGGKPVHVWPEPKEQRFPNWSHDKQHIYFSSNRENGWQLWKMDASGSTPKRVTHNGGYLAQESPDGNTLYYSKYGEPGLWKREGDGKEVLVISDLMLPDWGNWAVTETGLFYIARNQQMASLTFNNLISDSTQVLAQFPLYVLSQESGLSVSPDGSQLLLTRTDRSESDIMLVDLNPN